MVSSASEQEMDVYSAGEIARAAGVRVRDVRTLAASGVIRSIDGRFFTSTEAVLAVRSLSLTIAADRPLFRPAAGVRREPGLPIALSGTLLAVMLGGAGTIGFNIPTMSLIVRQSAEVHAMIRGGLYK